MSQARKQDSESYPVHTNDTTTTTPPTTASHHNAFENMLNMDEIAREDAEIGRAEAGRDFKSPTGAFVSNNNNNNNTNHINNDHDAVGLGEGLSTTITYSDPPTYEEGLGHRVRCHAKLLRNHQIGGKVTNIELFFDLVFVYAISVISETMVHHLVWEVVLEMLVVTLAIWWAWVFSTWVFNWFNPESYLVRLLLMALMLVNLIMSAFIGEAYGSQSLLFAGMYVLIQVGRNVAAVLALHGHKLQRNFIRLLSWFLMTAVLWLVGGAIGGTTRNVLWTVAIVLEYISPAAGFYTPGLGKSISTDWEIHGGHMAERCSLFIIIALGESIVVTGEAFREAFHEPAGIGMFIVSFVGATAMWWIYFHTASSEAAEYVEHSADPGKMGRLAYTYIHVLMVIGIIWCAVADRISMEDPYMVPHHEHDKMIYVAIMIGGPSLFVLGHALFRRTFCSRIPAAHLMTVAALICATPIGIFLPLWATALTTTILLVLLGAWESYFRCVILPNPHTA